MSRFLKRLTLGEDAGNKTLNIPYLVLVILLILSFGVTFLFYQSAKSKDVIRFNNSVNRVQSAIENKINLYVALLKSGRGFIESTQNLSREKFANYVKSLELANNYAGVQGIGYTKVVFPQEKDTLVKQMKSEGFSDFTFFPPSESGDEIQYTVIYFEPLDERSRQNIGFNVSTEDSIRQALNRARDFGVPAATARVALLPARQAGAKFTLLPDGEAKKQTGFLIYLPVYNGNSSPSTPQERKEKLRGYIYCQFRAEDLLDIIQRETAASNIALKIFDDTIKSENLLVQTAVENTPTRFSNRLEQELSTTGSIDVAGRKWVIEYSSLPALFEQSNVSWIPFILLSGVVLSFLFFALTYAQARSRLKLQETAAELYDLEQQKQTLLEKEQRARLTAEQANRTKDEFISVVSHELRTPLNAIAGWTKILKTENLSAHTKELALLKIERNLRSQTVLVEEILDFSQIISGKANLETKPVDFSAVFEKTFEELEPQARGKNISFIKENQLNGQKVLGDREKIKIIVANLFSNAIKYTPPGGKIETKVLEKDETIFLTVKDSGKGISKEFLPHIFDRFRQDDASTTRFYGGLGLGLAISEHLVKLHNGTIQAESEGSEKGSIFTVRLPSVK